MKLQLDIKTLLLSKQIREEKEHLISKRLNSLGVLMKRHKKILKIFGQV